MVKGGNIIDKLELKVLKYIYKFGNKGIYLKTIQKHFKKINPNTIKVIVSDFYISDNVEYAELNNDFLVKITYLGCRVIENNKLNRKEKFFNFCEKLFFTALGAILGASLKYIFDYFLKK